VTGERQAIEQHIAERAAQALCGWCLGDHPIAECPKRPRLSAQSVVAFALAAAGGAR
jgi:protein-disulfide isomerase-like protein with CxxC motif